MPASTKSMLIALEGIDCSGKSTQATIVGTQLDLLGMPTRITRSLSPAIGASIKHYIGTSYAGGAEKALLFAADRLIRYRSEVEPSLAKGINVIADRWILSSVAYQCTEDVPLEFIRNANQFVATPDISIIIDVSVEEARHRARIANRSEPNASYLELVRRAYLQLSDEKDVVVVDGNQAEGPLANEILQIVAARLGLDISM